jgi:hypothetical protein
MAAPLKIDDATSFMLEAHGVVLSRIAMAASGDPRAADESHRMVAEKFAAFAAGGFAAYRAFASGQAPQAVAEAAFEPIRRQVRENSLRLAEPTPTAPAQPAEDAEDEISAPLPGI